MPVPGTCVTHVLPTVEVEFSIHAGAMNTYAYTIEDMS